jgi:hypothetical protein
VKKAGRPITIREIYERFSRPTGEAPHDRRWDKAGDLEFTIYRVENVKIAELIRRSDRDYHLEILETNGYPSPLRTESVHPGCARGSHFICELTGVRQRLDRRFPDLPDTPIDAPVDRAKDVLVTVEGIGFWDDDVLELHPLTFISFNK